MKKEVLFVLLDEYADWEGAFLSTSLNFGVMPGSDKKYILNRLLFRLPPPKKKSVLLEDSERYPIIVFGICPKIMPL